MNCGTEQNRRNIWRISTLVGALEVGEARTLMERNANGEDLLY